MNELHGAIHRTLHKLWTKAVGTDDYDKKEWTELERYIARLEQLERAATKALNE